MTDSSGSLRYTANYDPYGQVIDQSGTYASTLGFTGEYTDASGLQYLRARYYNPSLGTFASLDPVQGMLGKGVTFNPYLYTGANPVIAVSSLIPDFSPLKIRPNVRPFVRHRPELLCYKETISRDRRLAARTPRPIGDS